MSCSVLIHKVYNDQSIVKVKTRNCGCKSHKILLIRGYRSIRTKRQYDLLQYTLCQQHVDSLTKKGMEFFTQPEFFDINNKQILHPRLIHSYKIFSNWFNFEICNFELKNLSEIISNKLHRQRNHLKNQFKRLLIQQNLKNLTIQDWEEMVKEAWQEFTVESSMES